MNNADLVAPETPPGLTRGFKLVLLLAALYIAGCSAFFSVRGLGLLFVGSEMPVMVMAASLEVGKLVAASFLYRYWDRINGSLRFYLATAVVLLIAVTSLGNYGYLARAYEKTATQIGRNETEIAVLEKDIVEIQRQIDDSRGRSTRLTSASRDDLTKAQSRLTQATEALSTALARLHEQRKAVNGRLVQELSTPTQRAAGLTADLAKSIAAEEASAAKAVASEDAVIVSLNERIKVLDQAVAAYTVQGTTSALIFFSQDNVRKGQELRETQKPERDAITAKLTDSGQRIERFRADSAARIAMLRIEQNRLNNESGKEVGSLRQQFTAELARVDEEEKGLRRSSAADIAALEQQFAALQQQGQGKVTVSDGEIERLRQSVTSRQGQIHDLRDQIAASDIGSYRFVARAFDAEADDVVKWLMLALVAVFDPLAVTLVIAFNMAIQGPASRPAEPAGGRPSGRGRHWATWEIALIAILFGTFALLVAWAWVTDQPAAPGRSGGRTSLAIPGDSFAVVAFRPDELRQKNTKAFPEWLERAGGKGMSAAFAELMRNGLDAHSEIYAFAKFPSQPISDAARPVMLCGAVLRVTDPIAAESALSRIADEMNDSLRGEQGRSASRLVRSRAMIRHGEGRYMDPEGGFFTFGLMDRTAIILLEFEGDPRAPCVEQEIRRCLLRPDQRAVRADGKPAERLPAAVADQPGAVALWMDTGRFFRRLPMHAETRRRFASLQPTMDFEVRLALRATSHDTLVLDGAYAYQAERFGEGALREPLAELARLGSPKQPDLAWKLIGRCADTLDFDAMIERLRGALGDGQTGSASKVLVEKTIPSSRAANFTMNARFDPKAGPPLLTAMALLAR